MLVIESEVPFVTHHRKECEGAEGAHPGKRDDHRQQTRQLGSGREGVKKRGAMAQHDVALSEVDSSRVVRTMNCPPTHQVGVVQMSQPIEARK